MMFKRFKHNRQLQYKVAALAVCIAGGVVLGALSLWAPDVLAWCSDVLRVLWLVFIAL